ncbi:uncharacterized protein LOC128962416 [Oppia nitens]|uniref:uncharacterized protein LOC128962416 n=1 Tax=Oppia nitens TaxID=1686743 RepID=UPI0023DBB530|nr:uncharacterized protein LOC128962416 [Oppia nitens]
MEETLFEMLAVSERKSIYRTINALKKIFQEYQQMNETIEKEKVVNLNSFHTELENIRRCILTPTRLLILPPQPTLTSRFIVNAKADYAIRLSIREDTLESLQFTVQSQRHFLPLQKKAISDFLKRTIKTPIEDSIRIGDRYFKFLGSSSSSLRDAGMILYAKDPDGTTAQLIRENIGEMSHIRKNVAKYVARLGLAFSQVMKHIIVNPNSNETEVINDIEGDFKVDENGDKLDEKYNFSDGIGRVSIDIMKEVYKELPNECTNKPSAMQIRYGGCKGMLVLDPKLKGRKILFRESMQKYKSDAKELGIIKLSLPRSLYLNRPFITILEQLGVESNIFLKMLMKDLKGLSNAMICECAATPLLRSHSTLGIPYTKLLKYGIPFLSEPIFRQIVDSVINHRIVELKRKARIKVPMNSGRTVFGVLDETSTLEYGQVFVQLSEVDEDNMPQDKTFILKEKIMVTKFPCLHPGDVRKFEAIDVPELHHIKDCIVFPQKGSRPHPDEMAGSDLDGDEYAVIWQSNLIFENENNKPMIFPTTKAKELHKEADVSDILDFYCDYIICNNVGVLANAHLANADLKDKGIFDDICMKLAHKYAVSLDFAKTGQTEELETKERPKLYPDFMEKFAQKRSYLSNKTLGQIYRYCDRYSLGIYSNRNLEIKAEPNPTFILEGWQRYEESAKNAYQTYKLKVMFLLNRFGLDNEATLLSGTFSKTTKYMTGRNETNDVHELLENMINKLFIEFKDRFNFESTNDNDSEDERRLRASAWYVVPFNADVGINERYFGFSWTITEELCKLHKDNDKFNVNKVDHKCIHLMTNFIDKYFYDNYIYRDPVIDNSITDVEKRRLIEMRSRLESAEVVLRAWLERQDHLFFKRNIKKKLISSTDYVISDMDRKLRRKFTQMRCLEMEIATKCLTKPLKTSGQLIMTFFKEAVDEWLNIDNNRRIVDTPLIKFGFSALMTLYHFFKTREISHIIDLRPKFTISLQSPVRELSFFISLDIPMPRKSQQNKDEKIKPKSSAESKLEFAINKRQEQRIELMKKYVEYMVVNSDQFIEKLKFISGAIEIYLEPYPLKTKRVQHYYLLTASGTVWSLQTIKNFISHPSFFNTVVNHDIPWKRKNLFYKGDPALESIAEIKS